MLFYDAKTKGAIQKENQLILSLVQSSDDVTFKASFIITSDISCDGKVTALFDLIVLGDITAAELDVKGRFVCMGQCSISNSMVVQNDIWAEEIQAGSVICHEQIVTQSLDADTVTCDGNIIVGKTIAIEDKVKSYQKIICGETAYGAGKIIASTILTAEPLDMDDGEEAIESPFIYKPQNNTGGTSELSKESAKYAKDNDYEGFLTKLLLVPDGLAQKRFSRYLSVLRAIDIAYPASVSEFRDAALLIWLIEISNSEYFKGWTTISEWTDSVRTHFINMSAGRLSAEQEAKPAAKLLKGYTVSHKTYGRGVVTDILQAKGKMAVISFDNHGTKKFPLPDSLKYFVVLSEAQEPTKNEVIASIQCNIGGYSEWLTALQLVDDYKAYLGDDLYNILYGLLLAKLGLKAKFVEDRFKEKGWN